MKYEKLFRTIWMLATAAFIFSSCQKVPAPLPLGDAGQILVKFIKGGKTANPGGDSVEVEANSQLPVKIIAADLRREVPDNTELQKPMTVMVLDDPGAVTSYDPSVVTLPVESYKITSPTPLTGTSYNVSFAAGQFGQDIEITLNNTLALAPGKRYGIGFTVKSVGNGNAKILSEEKTVVYIVKVKEIRNRWDGVYKVSGQFFHPVNAALIGPFGTSATGGNLFCEMISTSQTSLNRSYGSTVGESVVIFNSASMQLTYLLSVKPRFTVDSTTNLVTLTSSPGSTAFDTSPFDCKYDPAAKTFTLHYAWTAADSPLQRVITEILTYIGPR